jgi:formamidopyrimidine-DNA glycosylase
MRNHGGMPESPEVAELASFLAAHTAGRTISSVDVLLPKALKTQHPAPADLVGRRVVGVERFGKMIDIAAASDEDTLHAVVHFGHDGWVLWHDVVPEGSKRAGEATLMGRVRLDDGSGFDLTDAGQWKALTIHVVRDVSEVPAVAKLGIDPLSGGLDDEQFRAAFARALGGRKKQIKALLQDQAAFAGIGNAYSDEILHDAKISPVIHAASLTPGEVARLADLTRTTLSAATRERVGVRPDDLRASKHAALRVHRKTGRPCPVCGDTIREYRFSGAAAQYCPTCQTGGTIMEA